MEDFIAPVVFSATPAITRKPLAIDLFCGLGGWADGFLAEGYRVVGFDIERHDYGTGGYPGQLVLQDVLTLDGRQFKGAAVIVASPPCQEYSYMAMPWSRAKEKAAYIRARQTEWARLTALFWACFRIAREAKVPLVVENVKGAQPWVGRAKANYGSFFLWGDVESVGGAIVAPRPKFGETLRAKRGVMKNGVTHRSGGQTNFHGDTYGRKNGGGSWFAIGSPGQENVGQNPDGRKVPGMNFHEHERTGKPGWSFQSAAMDEVKHGGDWFFGYGGGFGWDHSQMRQHSSKSPARKAASVQIAKIPFPLASHIARIYRP